MGANAGPDIVSDGLVLALDAADNNSFRGESTENLFATFSSNENNATLVGVSPISLDCGSSGNWSRCNYGGGTFAYSHIETTNPYGVTSLVGNLVATVSGGDYRATISNIGATTLNRTFTFSIWVKNNGGSTTSLSMSIRTNGDANGITVGKSFTNEWQRISITHTFTGTCTAEIRSYLFSVNAGTNILLYGAQLEEKSYPTRFVNGTRGTTVATGGGWADISGNSNHGEILNGTSTSNDNTVLGALDFDGTDDYIPITSLLNSESIGSSTKLTISMWLNQTSKGNRMPFSTGQTGNDRIYYWTENGLNTWRVGNYVSTTGHASLPANGVWYHTAIVIDGLTVAGYFNGELDYTGTYSAFTTVDYATLGRHGSRNEYYYSGKIAGVTVHNQALTASEVLQNYNSLKTRFGL